MDSEVLISVIVFTKVPKPGFVKTRVSMPKAPSTFSSSLQTAMLKDTLTLVNLIKEPCTPVLSFHPENAKKELEQIILRPLFSNQMNNYRNWTVIPQRGGTISERFSNIFDYVFNSLKVKSALIIGSDTPHLQPVILDDAIGVLKGNIKNSVIGPSQRGGFYLLGHNSPFISHIGQIFHQESKKTELENASNLLSTSTNVHNLPEVRDIDTFEDLKFFWKTMKTLRSREQTAKDFCFPEKTIEILEPYEDLLQ
jgi:glycosyltransferase A (GT-A) superfamily protein (DUF2064 family)